VTKVATCKRLKLCLTWDLGDGKFTLWICRKEPVLGEDGIWRLAHGEQQPILLMGFSQLDSLKHAGERLQFEFEL